MEKTYRDILNQSFRDKSQANPSYSLRSFARDLGVPPSTLSEVLSGKKGLSPKRSAALAQALRLPAWQSQLFCDLVAKDHAKNPNLRKEAKLRLKSKKQENHLKILNHTAMKALTSWVDLAILELTYLKTFKPSPSWIARELGVEESAVTHSISRLREANLLEINEKTGAWTDVSPLFSSTDGVPSEAIRNFQRSVLLLGLKKLENPDTNARTVKSVVFSLSEANLKQAKEILNEAVAKIVSLADDGDQPREQVACFSAQLFSLLDSKKENS